jgi:NTE family protein
MGAIIGGLYACGMNAAEIVRFALEKFDIGQYMESFAFRLNGPVGKIFQAGQILGSLAGSRGIDPGEKILALLEELTGGKTFAETRFPFRCNAVDLLTGEEVVFNSGPVARAMRASMSFPVFFEPFRDGGRYLADGGLADNIPVAIARKAGFRRVLAVNVGRFVPARAEDLKNVPQIVYRSLEAVQLFMARDKPQADLTIHAADGSTPFDFGRKAELVALGERAVKESVPALEAFFRGGPGFWFFRRRRRDSGVSCPPGQPGAKP